MEENFESMDSTFTPIGSTDSRSRSLKKLKIEETEDFKNSKFEEVKD
jgi:hypothetical protein